MIDNKTTRNKAYEIDISNKYLLTIKEGASYFNIGENKLMSILKSNPDTLLFMNGTKQLIKRKAFENWIDNTSSC